MISLLTEKWIPVRRADGRADWILPSQVCEPDIVCFAAHRGDFNGALVQFLIGLLQTSSPALRENEWETFFKSPPSSETLSAWFERFEPAFILDGDGPRFMQDLGLDSGAECGIDALLIDAPGGSAIDKNTDLFVKRGTVSAMCPHCAALALFTLQTNAPAGGAGHRTSLRGGGPLSTLVVCSPSRSLWQDLWLNVLPQRDFLARGGDVEKTAPYFTFPWLAQTQAIQAPGAETQPVQVHPYHVYWAMPRRIRLDFGNLRAGQCDVCKRESNSLLQNYVTRPQGLNYKGPWRHPLSPYYETKEGWLPMHPQPGGFTYRHWLSWALGTSNGKKAVEAAVNVRHAVSDRPGLAGAVRLWVFGYDMDNMKARCWYETTFPLYGLAGCRPKEHRNFSTMTAALIEAAEQAVFYLRQAVKQAWFGDGDVRGDLSFVDKMFWDGTDSAFHRHLQALIERASSEHGVGRIDEDFCREHAVEWHRELSGKALDLFEVDIVGAGSITRQDPHRIAEAYRGLKRNLDGKALRALLGLPQAESGKGKRHSA
jgi:CRISPR system Cascade subunit CasA